MLYISKSGIGEGGSVNQSDENNIFIFRFFVRKTVVFFLRKST